MADDPHLRGVRAPAREPRVAGLGPNGGLGLGRASDRVGSDRSEDPRGLGRLSADHRRDARDGRGLRRRRLSAHRRPQRIGRAGGDGRRDRRSVGPRLSRRGRRRWTHPGSARDRPRAERDLLVDDAEPSVRPRGCRRARRHDPDRPRREPFAPRGRGGRARADPPQNDGRGGAAARARRDLHREQRLAGHGADRRDGPPDVAARARDEVVARVGGRGRMARRASHRGRRQPTGPPLSGEAHRRAGEDPRAPRRGRIPRTRSPGRPGPVGAVVLRREAARGDEGRGHRLGPDRRGQRIRARRGADQVRSRLGGHGRRPAGPRGHLRLEGRR